MILVCGVFASNNNNKPTRMDAIQRGKLLMSMTSRDFLLPNATITTPLPNFTANFSTVQNTITQIQTVAQMQDFEKSGISDVKKQSKIILCGLAADLSRKLVTFARFTNNLVLLKEIKMSESTLKRLPDVDLKTKAQELYDRAQSNIASLASYGITAASQTALLAAITSFTASIPKPRLGIDETKQATQQLLVLFKTLDAAWENIDLAIEIVRLTQVNFYNGYKTARKVIVTGGSSIALRGMVTDAATGEPVSNACIEFWPVDGVLMAVDAAKSAKAKPLVEKKTARKGGVMVKSLPEGQYQVTIKKGGYADVVTRVYITNGELCVLDVAIKKN